MRTGQIFRAAHAANTSAANPGATPLWIAATIEVRAHTTVVMIRVSTAKANRQEASRGRRSAASHSAPNGTITNPAAPSICAIADNGTARRSYPPGKKGSTVQRMRDAVGGQDAGQVHWRRPKRKLTKVRPRS